MISLAAMTLCAGCTRPPPLPPQASISRSPDGAGGNPGGSPFGPPRQAAPETQYRFDEPDLSRWQANPWKPEVSPRQWHSIVIHHTATDRGSVESIHETHLDRKWLGIGYHFVIGNGSGMPDGQIEPTFRWREQLHGAHAGDDEHNQHGVGVALVGNFDEQPPTPAQLAAVKRLVGVLKAEYGIPASQVIGHSDIKATACPGRHFPMAEVSRSSIELQLGEAGRPAAVQLATRHGHPARARSRTGRQPGSPLAGE